MNQGRQRAPVRSRSMRIRHRHAAGLIPAAALAACASLSQLSAGEAPTPAEAAHGHDRFASLMGGVEDWPEMPKSEVGTRLAARIADAVKGKAA